MDIDRVRYFHAFSETGSLVQASALLHISQPALSKALRTLEAELGVKLVEPDGRGLRLTGQGKRFRTETAPLLTQWLGIPQKLKEVSPSKPTRLGSFEVFTTYFLSYLSKYIGLESLEVHELGPGKLEHAIASGQTDFGITYLPVPTSGVEFVEVTQIKMGVFGTSGVAHRFAEKDFRDLPFAIPLLPAEGTPSKMIGLDGWPDHRFERNIKYRVTMMESALELCRKGLCVAYLPEFVVRLQNEDLRAERRLVEIASPLQAKDRRQSVFLVRPKNSNESRLHRKIAQCLRSVGS